MTKQCVSCKEVKLFSDFHKRTKSKDGLQNNCKICNRKQRSQYYKTAKGREVNIFAGKRMQDKNRRLIFDYLMDHACVDCGVKNPVILQFDHREPKEKSFNISKKWRMLSWNTLLKEIEKCDIRCANCHFMRTARQFGWHSLKWWEDHLAELV